MEWRPEYKIHVSQYQENQNKLSASIEVPSEYPLLGFSNWGIYKHFETHVVSDRTIRIVPRFLFGLSHEAIGKSRKYSLFYIFGKNYTFYMISKNM